MSEHDPSEIRRHAGQPTKYKPEYIAQAEKLARLGATDVEIADFFGVAVRVLYRWKVVHPKFSDALKVGKEEADSRVERSLYQLACGYEQDSVKIFMPANSDEPVYAAYREKIAPNPTACVFWLKNRKQKEWRDRQEIGGIDGKPIEAAITVRFVKPGQDAGTDQR